MNKYIEKIFNELIPDNKGYTYMCTENIFIPLYRVTLSITKRKQTALNLVEEMVLRIVNCGLTDIDEIAGVLGLSRDILDITIGDLYNKCLAYPSSNKCYLMKEGHNILNVLVSYKKEKDLLRDVYVNALSQEILKDPLDDKVTNIADDDCKVHHSFDGKNIEFYRDRVADIKVIFNKENEYYSSDSNHLPDELFSIDDIEDISVCFIKMPIHIYVSQTGFDLDLISGDVKLNSLLDRIKGDILEQLRKHRLLKKIFTRHTMKELCVPTGTFEDSNVLKVLVKKYVNEKDNQSNYLELITSKVYSNRILIENELEKFFELSLQGVQKVKFYVDSLDYWSKSTRFITLIALIPQKTNYEILYKNVGNMNFSEKRIKTSLPNITRDIFKQVEHDNWFMIMFGDKIQIIGCPQNYKAIDNQTWIVRSTYYLRFLP
jgi:hypothetical protein